MSNLNIIFFMKHTFIHIIIACLSLALTAKAQTDGCVVTAFPYSEGFENDGGKLPECWEQEFVTNQMEWIVTNGGHSGEYKVFMPLGSGQVTKLISPRLDISTLKSPTLTFWQLSPAWGASIDVLRVYCQTSASGEWKQIGEYNQSCPEWTKRVVTLPESSAFYRVAFEGELHFANGISIDDISIGEASSAPVISGKKTLNLGTVYNNLPWGAFSKYDVTNEGNGVLAISSVSQQSGGITISGLPVEVSPMQTKSLPVEVSTQSLPAGEYTGQFTLGTNDPASPQFTVDVKARVAAAVTTNYVNETFNEADPEGWGTQSFTRISDGGTDNSGCVRTLLHANTPQGGVQTPYVQMGESPTVQFKYKAVNYADNTPAAADAVEYAVYISKDGGRNYDLAYSAPLGSHKPSESYQTVTVDASAYANELCLVQIVFEPGEKSEIWIYMDDVKVGTKPVNELAATKIAGSLVTKPGVKQAYTVTVENKGSEVQGGYTVKLMQGDGTETAQKTGDEIMPGERKDFTFEWTASTTGTFHLYGKVEADGDEYADNDATDKIKVLVMPETISEITAGNGEELYKYPYNLYFPESLTQTLYTANEIGVNSGDIHSLIYQADITVPSNSLQDMPVRVWVGETDRQNLKDGWADPFTLTEVYNGTISIPEGRNDVVILLDAPYKYKGGNLVVYSHSKLSAGSDFNNNFIGTELPGSYRSIQYSSFAGGDINPQMPPAFSEGAHGIPNTTFLVEGHYGRLEGTVTAEGKAVEGATVRIAGTQLTTVTDAAGHYEFARIQEGAYTVEAEKYSYATMTADGMMTKGETVKRDITLQPIPTFTVSGKITGPDGTSGLAGATVRLTGYNEYEATADAAGSYSIPGVFGGFTYEMEVRLKGYATHNSTVEVTDADKAINVPLEEKAYPTVNVKAKAESGKAVITWDAPIGYETKSYIYDDGTYENGWANSNTAITAWFGTQFTTGESGEITSVDLYGLKPQMGEASERTLTVEIFDENRELIGTSEPFLLPGYDWINVPLNNIPYSGTFYAMVKWAANEEGSTNFLGFDQDGPHAADGTDWYCDSNEGWKTIYSITEGIKGTFMIRANVDAETGSGITEKAYGHGTKTYKIRTMADAEMPTGKIEGLEMTAPAVPGSTGSAPQHAAAAAQRIPSPVKYMVYRLEENAPEDTWEHLGTVTSTTFTDNGFTSIPDGLYQYAVKAVYYGDKTSEARLSNTLSKGLDVKVSISVTTNSGATADGAEVTLTNKDMNPEHVYTAYVKDSEAVFGNVRKGTYDITASMGGFELYERKDVSISTDVSLGIQLREKIENPFGLKVEPLGNGTDYLFTWNNPTAEEKCISYWSEPNYSNLSSIYEKTGEGYGVIFDLTAYPDATLTAIDFHHAPWGGSGTWDYKVHVVDMENMQTVYTSDVMQTTGDNKWEEGISLNAITGLGGKKAGVFIEPMSTYNNDVFPILSADNISGTKNSCKIDLATMATMPIEGIQGKLGEYLMNLWITTGQEDGDGAQGTTATTPVYTVYLNGEARGTTKDTQYRFTALEEGEYTAGVKAVYATGESETETVQFSVTASGTGNTAATGIGIHCDGKKIAIANNGNIRLHSMQVISTAGQVVFHTEDFRPTVFNINAPDGCYIVRLLSDNGTDVVKIRLRQ